MTPRHLSFTLATLSACSAPVTQVLVWVDADPAALEGATALRVVARDQGGAEVFAESRALMGLRFPLSVSLVPKEEYPTRRFELELELTSDAGAIAQQLVEGSFVPEVIAEIRVRFDEACRGVSCGEGRSCVDGRCRRACYVASVVTATRTAPGPCPCACECAGDRCEDGACVPARPARALSAGHDHACALFEDGAAACWGDNALGQIGAPERDATPRPRAVALEGPARAIAAGASFSCAALEDGRVFCFGDAAHGQLGPAVTTGTHQPTAIVDGQGAPLARVISVGAGGVVGASEASAHACAATSDGAVYCWGRNDFGQLGLGVTGERSAPARVMTNLAVDGIEALELGGFHTCGRQRIGRLSCWGRNHDWQLGFPDHLDRSTPELISRETGFAGIIDAAAGTWHSCAISQDGRLWCWGEDGEGRLGVTSMADDLMEPTIVLGDRRWRAVEGGHRHGCAIDASGSLWCFGTSVDGEAGVRGAEGAPSTAPVQLRDEPWAQFALGTSFTCGIREGGAVYCWGKNDRGQLGVGDRERRVTPARVCAP